MLLQKAIAKTKQGYYFFEKNFYVRSVNTLFSYATIIIEEMDEVLEGV